MSAFLSVRYPDAIRMLTDGSAFDPDTKALGAVIQKARCGTSVPIAVTGRGKQNAVELMGEAIVRYADHCGSFDGAMDWTRRLAAKAKDEGTRRNPPFFDLLIAGWSETNGPQQFSLSSHNESPGFPAFELIEMGPIAAGAPDIQHELPALFSSVGMSIADPRFLELHGADLMELMRRSIQCVDFSVGGQTKGYTIGGHCQLTVITAEGAETITLRVWDDQIGELINPFSNDGKVVPLANAKLSQRELSLNALRMKRGQR